MARDESACINPALCSQKFSHLDEKITTVFSKVDRINAKMFESNGESFDTRLSLIENWRDEEMKTRSFEKRWFYGILAALIVNLLVGLWNRSEMLASWNAVANSLVQIQQVDQRALQQQQQQPVPDNAGGSQK